MIYTCSTVIKRVAIDQVRHHLPDLMDTAFTRLEQQELHHRHVRSTAGMLALKKALCSLLGQKTGAKFTEKSFVLSHTDSGKPILVSRPPFLKDSNPTQTLFLSISHSRHTAYGLAVLQEAGK